MIPLPQCRSERISPEKEAAEEIITEETGIAGTTGGRIVDVRKAETAGIRCRMERGAGRRPNARCGRIMQKERIAADRPVITGMWDVVPTGSDTAIAEAAMTGEEQNSLLKPNERIDDLQRSHLRIIQDPGKFQFGMDAVLLSGFARAEGGDHVLDLCSGTGIIPILMTAKTGAEHFTALEIQMESADMAERSVRLNHLQDRVAVVRGDLREADALFAPASFDVVTCNPPYMPASHGLVNPNDAKAIARHEICCTFEDVVRVTEKLIIPGGHFFLVHRPFRLAEIMVTLCAHHLEPKRMRMVYPYVDREPNMVLLECVRGAKSRITVEKPLIVYQEPGRYTDEIYDIYGY